MDKASLIEKAVGRLTEGGTPASPQPDQAAAPRPPREGETARPNDPAASAGTLRADGTRRPGQDSDAPADGHDVSIDLQALRQRGFLTPDGERTAVAEEFRMIKRPLLANAFGKSAALVESGNLIMVTSARAGEGKTFTAVNLAMSIAMEMDKTVLLVDADVARAQVHKILGSPSGPGLIDLLLDDKMDVGDVLLRTSVPKLRLIPMGRYHPHSTELLASAEMLRLTRELASRYPDRVVIFDAPPLLVTSEASVLAGLMGQIVFVVQSERTPQGDVKDALELLDQAKPIGLVLNKIRRGIGGYGYGAGYGYGYGYGYHPKD
jgi:exopolysaccharide/PEP-CTERM locus tyrosine autokinase